MREVDRAICLEIEKALCEYKDKSFIELLYELEVISPELNVNEDSEITYARIKKKIENVIPITAEECLNAIKKACEQAVRIYDNEEFYEDDCDRFLGESTMAQKVLELICSYESFQEMGKIDEKQ